MASLQTQTAVQILQLVSEKMAGELGLDKDNASVESGERDSMTQGSGEPTGKSKGALLLVDGRQVCFPTPESASARCNTEAACMLLIHDHAAPESQRHSFV